MGTCQDETGETSGAGVSKIAKSKLCVIGGFDDSGFCEFRVRVQHRSGRWGRVVASIKYINVLLGFPLDPPVGVHV